MKIWTCGSSPRSGSRNAWTRIKNVNGASRLSNFWNFFGAIQMISCCDWWPWTKPGYITMTRRQSNNQWSIAAHPAPKNSECKNPLEKFSPRFFGIKTASSSLVIFQRAKLSTQSITQLCWCNWTFWRKNAAGRSPRKSCSCKIMPRLTGRLQPRRNWPTWASNVLITHPILRIWIRRTTTCSLDWKNNWKIAIFRSTRGQLPRGPGWTDLLIFLSGLQKLEQRAMKCIKLRGEYVEQIPSLVAVAFSFLVRLRTYQHPLVNAVTAVWVMIWLHLWLTTKSLVATLV